VVEGPAYSHLDLTELSDAILLVERQAHDGIQQDGSHKKVSVRLSRRNSHRTLALPSPEQSEVDKQNSTGADKRPFQIVVKDETGMLHPEDMKSLLKTILHMRVTNATKVVHDEWSIDSNALMRMAERATRPAWQVSKYEDQLHNLPMVTNRLNIELVRIYLQLLSRFKAALDGAPDPGNRFMKHWVPVSIKSPLLLQIVLYTSACFLNETGQLPKMVVWAHKSAVHKMINEHIASAGRNLSDECIMGTAQMVLDSWYWGTTEEMQAHMLGLRSMVKMRGGFQVLGMQGFLAKTIIADDIVISLAHEIEPSMFDTPGFEFKDEFMVPYQTAFNSPLMQDWPPFANPASALDLHPHAAQILDDVRQMLKVVVELPDDLKDQTPEQLQQVAEVAAWAYQRISMMPENMPERVDTGKSTSFISEAETPASSRWKSDDQGSSPANTYSSSVFEGSTMQDDQVLTPDTSPGRSDPQQAGTAQKPDLMYRVIRMVALIYCRAVLARVPTSEVCDSMEFLQLWVHIWEITLAKWKKVLGVYQWVTVGLIPSGHNTAPARFSKMLMVTGLLSIGLDNWHIAMDIGRAALKLQRFLRQGNRTPEKGVVGGEAGVETFGFPIKEDLPDVAKYATVLEELEDDAEEMD
jgi:hypothetical protein